MKKAKEILVFVLIMGFIMTLALIVPACTPPAACAVKAKMIKKYIKKKQKVEYVPYYSRKR